MPDQRCASCVAGNAKPLSRRARRMRSRASRRLSRRDASARARTSKAGISFGARRFTAHIRMQPSALSDILIELSLPNAFWIFCAVGFIAQLIDGALGMAYGVVCIAVLSALGVPPAAASAVVHAAEVFTTGTAATSHALYKNIDRALFFRLAPAGVLGGVVGAYFLTAAPRDIIAPLLGGYLALIGVYLIFRALRRLEFRALQSNTSNWTIPLGAVGGFLDSWGGGWGRLWPRR